MKDKRSGLWAKQRRERGFDDRELWNLDITISKFILPRLKAFKKLNNSHPYKLNNNKWLKILDEIIEGLEIHITKDYMFDGNDIKKINRALKLLAKYYLELWD